MCNLAYGKVGTEQQRANFWGIYSFARIKMIFSERVKFEVVLIQIFHCDPIYKEVILLVNARVRYDGSFGCSKLTHLRFGIGFIAIQVILRNVDSENKERYYCISDCNNKL